MSSGNSNTATKTRQPQDEHFARFLSNVRTNGKPDQDIAHLENWRDLANDINTAALAGKVDDTLAALAKFNPRLAAILATLPDQDQEALHPDFRIGKQGKKVFRTLSEDEIEDFPDIEYMISGLLLTAAVSLLFGESNSGKTFVALDIAEHIARGLNWLGRRVKQGNVLYIYAESRIGLKPRIQAWKKHHSLPSTPNHLQFITRPVQLVNDRDFLLDTITEQEVTPALVVIDTFSNCAIGANQNDQAEVTKVLMVAHELVREYGCHVLVVHHSNKTDSVNGSAAFKNHVDTMMKLSRADKYSPVVMHCEKQRDAEQFDDIAMQLQVVDLYINQHLEPVTSCVVVAGDMIAASGTEGRTAQEQQQMIEVLEAHGSLHTDKWKKACSEAGVSRNKFYKHMSYLVGSGQVLKDDSRGAGNPTFFSLPPKVEQQPLQPLPTLTEYDQGDYPTLTTLTTTL